MLRQWGILLRVQMLGAFGLNKALHAKDGGERRKLAGFAAMMLFAGLAVEFAVVLYSVILGEVFTHRGMPEMLPALMMAVASVITLFTTVYKVNGVLFGFKDYDITMSLPAPTSVIVASRLGQLYLTDTAFTAAVLLPSGIVYMVRNGAPWWFLPLQLFLTLIVPMVPMIVATAVGSLITLISSRFRRTNLINLALTLALVVGVLVVSMNMPATGEGIGELGTALVNAVYGLYPLTRMYTEALCEGSLGQLALFVLLSAALFAGFCVLIGQCYKSLNTALTTSRARAAFHMTALKVSSPVAALYKRELRRYIASPLYVMNTVVGMLLALLAAGALLMLGPTRLAALIAIPGSAEMIVDFAPFALMVIIGMSSTTASAISIEGRQLWIVKSLPVTPMQVFRAKMLVNLTMTAPLSFVASVLVTVALPVTLLQGIFLFLLPLVYAVFCAAAGLLINLRYPNLTWTSEAQVIKQSASVLVTMLAGMGLAALSTAAVAALPASLRALGSAGTAVLFSGLSVLLYHRLRTAGSRAFLELN